MHFTGTKDPENPAKLNMKLDDTPDAPARMVFGCRSCDARGFAVLDKPFLEGKFQDAYYKARRDNLLVVTGPATARAAPASATGPAAAPPIPPAPTCCSRP